MQKKMSVRLGYACISLAMKERDIFTSRTMTLATLRARGVEYAKELAMQNIEDLAQIVEFNEQRGIRFFRITSNLFPHYQNPQGIPYTIEFAREPLAKIGKRCRELGHRITCHPGQYSQLSSPNPKVVEQSILDLTAHADIFEMMGLTPELGTVMVIHGGGVHESRESSLNRFRENFWKLPPRVRQFIALENDEFSYSVLDLLPLCRELSIPLVVDFFHHQVGHQELFDVFSPEIWEQIIQIYTKRQIKPKCHWSNQKLGERRGTHGDCVEDIPAKIWNIAKKYNMDIMLEVKDKDECLMRMMHRYYFELIIEGRVYWDLKPAPN